jgi:broad specificity phosphatase PhoE
LAPTLNHIVDTCIAQGEQLAVIVSPLRRATQTALLAFEAAGLDMMSKSDKVRTAVYWPGHAYVFANELKHAACNDECFNPYDFILHAQN